MTKPSDTRGPFGGAARRLLVWLDRRSAPSPVVERALLLAAVLVFVVGGIIAFQRLPTSGLAVRWTLIAAAAIIGVPATVMLNGVEYQASARILGHRVTLLEALRISLLGSAANLLPIPGAAVVRMRGLRQLGSSYPHAIASTFIIGLAWLGTTGVLAGALQLRSSLGLGAVFLGVGTLLAGIAYGILRIHLDPDEAHTMAVQILYLEAGVVFVSALRIYLVLRGLGWQVAVSQAAALTVSGAMASAVGVVPGGLGLRELIGAAVSPLVGLPATMGFLAIAVDRLADLILLIPLSAGLLLYMYLRDTPDIRRDGSPK